MARIIALVLYIVTGIVIALVGLAMLGLGIRLAMLGGSLYYVIAGAVFAAAGVLIALRRLLGWWLYALAFLGTVGWSLWEVGLDGWQLMPRLFLFAVLGLWCSLLWFFARDASGRRARAVALPGGIVYLLVIGGIFGSGWWITSERSLQPGQVAAAQPAPVTADAGDWRYYGRTPAGDRFSPLHQITPDNVAQLEQVWRYDTGDMPRKGETKHGREFNFEVTPIKVGDTLYVCTPHRWVIALDATTGKRRWIHKPHSDTSANIYLACRGVAYYQAPGASGPCARRIIATTGDAHMIALDADTGTLCPGFGNHGVVSLTEHMGKVPPGFHFITSQPLVVGDRLILGGWIYDNQTVGEPSGVVRAYDPQTGRLAWAWDLGRADPNAPLAPGEHYTRGTPNAWGTYTADPQLGLVYLPLGNATPDYYGGERRPFDEEYASSLVALDIETGEERWHFQTVHHDVWDYDLPIGPSLVDLPGPGGSTIPALVQTTKLGQLFVLDRRTGKPLTDIVERPVPTDHALPGEHLSPTQPYVKGFPSLSPPDLHASDAWGATPIDQLMCRIQFRTARYEGQFTPPGLGTSIAYPAFDGVVDWYGASIDPTRHLLVVNSSYIPFLMTGMTHDDALQKNLIEPWKGWDSGQPYPKPKTFAVGPQYGTPFTVVVKPWLGPLDAPCAAPPWGRITAIDLATRKVVWQHPLGTTRDTNILGIHANVPLPTGVFVMGADVITGSGLVFTAGTVDDYLRAFDERTGEELWKGRLPAGGQATPITYKGEDGRQYVVIAAGGHGGLRTTTGDAIIAYALERPAP